MSFLQAAHEVSAELEVSEEVAMSFLAFNEANLARQQLREIARKQDILLRKLEEKDK